MSADRLYEFTVHGPAALMGTWRMTDCTEYLWGNFSVEPMTRTQIEELVAVFDECSPITWKDDGLTGEYEAPTDPNGDLVGIYTVTLTEVTPSRSSIRQDISRAILAACYNHLDNAETDEHGLSCDERGCGICNPGAEQAHADFMVALDAETLDYRALPLNLDDPEEVAWWLEMADEMDIPTEVPS